MMDIRIGPVGKIVSGKGAGKFVQFEKMDGDGGVLILTDTDRSMAAAYDCWVANVDELRDYIQESAWDIEWLAP